MENVVTIILPIVSLILGGALGYLTNQVKQRHAITLKILERFLMARDELCDKISYLATIKITDKLDTLKIKEISDEIYSLYFKNYDYYPREVSEGIACLHVCLSRKKHHMWVCKDGHLKRLKSENEITQLIDKIMLFENTATFGIMYLKSRNENIRKISSIRLQARSLLFTINQYLTVNRMMKLIPVLSKSKQTKRPNDLF